MTRITRGVAGAAAAIAATAALTVSTSAGAADNPARTTTQNFHANATSQLATGQTSFVLAEQDVDGTTVIGHDVLFCQATQDHSACQIAFAQSGGLIYAHFLIHDADHSVRGTITGGTGTYRHAHGTITGQVLSQSDVRVALRYTS